ncbi:MAG: hypothetical protein M0R66_00395 [Candidatus Omnitrophica bacterium]|nr:hypothetical protein [Candidatus Omnitrophota bacterium]
MRFPLVEARDFAIRTRHFRRNRRARFDFVVMLEAELRVIERTARDYPRDRRDASANGANSAMRDFHKRVERNFITRAGASIAITRARSITITRARSITITRARIAARAATRATRQCVGIRENKLLALDGNRPNNRADAINARASIRGCIARQLHARGKHRAPNGINAHHAFRAITRGV